MSILNKRSRGHAEKKAMRRLYVGNCPGGNYRGSKMDEFMEAHPELIGSFSNIRILHDDWCGFLKGRACNCDPDIEMMDSTPFEKVGA